MEKAVNFMVWVHRNTYPMSASRVCYKDVFYYINGNNHTGRNDLEELYGVFELTTKR